MAEQSLSALEFPGLLRVVQQYAVSPLGGIFWAGSSPSLICSESRQNFSKSRNGRNWRTGRAPFPWTISPLLTAWLTKVTVRGSLLPAEAFNEILQVLRLAGHLKTYPLSRDLTPHLLALAGGLKDLSRLTEAIQQCISPHISSWTRPAPAWPGCAGN